MPGNKNFNIGVMAEAISLFMALNMEKRTNIFILLTLTRNFIEKVMISGAPSRLLYGLSVTIYLKTKRNSAQKCVLKKHEKAYCKSPMKC